MLGELEGMVACVHFWRRGWGFEQGLELGKMELAEGVQVWLFV